MDVNLMVPAAGLALVVVVAVVVAVVAGVAAERRGRSRRLAILCALLLGLPTLAEALTLYAD